MWRRFKGVNYQKVNEGKADKEIDSKLITLLDRIGSGIARTDTILGGHCEQLRAQILLWSYKIVGR